MKQEVTFTLSRTGQTLHGQRTPVDVGTPTLCLHGWLDNCASFKPLFERSRATAGQAPSGRPPATTWTTWP